MLGAAGGSEAEPLLVTALRDDPNQAVRAAAALALGQTHDERALDPLIGALGEDDGFLRGQAEKALAQLALALPDGATRTWLALATAPGVTQERGLAVLGSLGAGGVAGLCAAATTGSEAAKAAAKGELARLPGDQLSAGLRAALRRKDADASAFAAAMLGDRGDPAALPALADAMSDPTQPSTVQTAARSALVRLTDSIDPALESRRFESEDSQDRRRAIELLAIKGGPPAEALALRALRDPSLLVQAAGAAALADLGSVKALPQLKLMLDREDEAPILRALQIAARRLDRLNHKDAK